jgi:hypothetical protein
VATQWALVLSRAVKRDAPDFEVGEGAVFGARSMRAGANAHSSAVLNRPAGRAVNELETTGGRRNSRILKRQLITKKRAMPRPRARSSGS